jgi:hypothetical protein
MKMQKSTIRPNCSISIFTDKNGSRLWVNQKPSFKHDKKINYNSPLIIDQAAILIY